MLGVGDQRSEPEIPRAAVEGGEDNFSCVRSLAPLAVAKFFSTLVPNLNIEKISAKAILAQWAPQDVFTNEDIRRLQMSTQSCKQVVITLPDFVRTPEQPFG